MAYTSLVSEDFYNTPWLGSLPNKSDEIVTFNVKDILVKLGVQVSQVSEILVYVFFTGLPGSTGQFQRAVYEIYTEGDGENERYSHLMNAVFNQPDTVINSANLWFPFTPSGELKARIPAKWSSTAQELAPKHKHHYKCLQEAMQAYVNSDEEAFMDAFLLGYRLKQ